MDIKYKIAFSDYDGTLIHDDGTVTDRTKKAIDDFIAHGGVFLINTGRVFSSISKMAKNLGLKGYVMSCQGALVSDIESGKHLMSITLDDEVAIEVLHYYEEHGVYAQLYPTDGEYYCKEKNEFTEFYASKCMVEPFETKVGLDEYVESKGIKLLKILAITYDENTARQIIADLQAKFGDRCNISWSRANPWFIECNDKRASKGNALKSVCEAMGIPVEYSVAFGDQKNDLSMLEEAGLGVAVANADEEVRKKADFVAKSNEEDGVAEFLEKYCV